MAERFPDFEIQESQELKENSEKQNTKKSTSTWLNVWDQLGRKQGPICSPKKRNNKQSVMHLAM